MKIGNSRLNTANHIFFTIAVLLLLISTTITFNKYFLKKDYIIYVEASCDPNFDYCFFVPCDTNDSSCLSKPIFYYKKVEVKAYNVGLCDPKSSECGPVECQEGNNDCKVTFCSDETRDDIEKCYPETN